MIFACLFYIYYECDWRSDFLCVFFVVIKTSFKKSSLLVLMIDKMVSISFKAFKDCFLFKLVYFTIKLFVEPIFSFNRFSNCVGGQWLSIRVGLTLVSILIGAWLFRMVLIAFRYKFRKLACHQPILDISYFKLFLIKVFIPKPTFGCLSTIASKRWRFYKK